MVRKYLNGRFANTAFCVLSPDGEERLSGTGRSPAMGLAPRGGRRGPDGDDDVVMEAMERIAKNYRPKGDPNTPVVQDFHSFRQALNVASGDQRLLLFVAAPAAEREGLRKSLRPVMGDPDIIGRFHADFGDTPDAEWAENIDGAKSKPGMFIVRAGKFGQDGKLLAQLPLDATAAEIKASLLKANAEFAKTEERKVYRDHVSQGKRQRVYFENGMPYGEDRDGDGVIDQRKGRRPER